MKNLKKSVFRVPKMDCPSEEKMVRMAVEGTQGVEGLKFDLNQRKLTIVYSNLTEAFLISKLEPLNYGAKLESTEEFQVDLEADDLLLKNSQNKDESKVLMLLLVINGGMFVVEMITGLMAQSMGLISDSLDMFADGAVYSVSLYAVGKAKSMQSRAAFLSGVLQLLLAVGALTEVTRRFFYGSEPNSPFMIGISLLALAANVSCLLLLSKHREGAVHMKASWIFSTNDVIANLGVIMAGILVYFLNSRIPDLVIGIIISFIVLRGSFVIIKLSRSSR